MDIHGLESGVANLYGFDKVITKRRSEARLLNEKFDESQGHHVDIDNIIYIPTKMHQSVQHCVATGYGMKRINAMAFRYLYNEVK